MMAEYLYYPAIQYFVHRVCTPGWIIKKQLIDFYDLTFVQGGKGEYCLNDVCYPVSTGDFLCIPPGVWREAQTDPDDPLRLFAFNLTLFDGQFKPSQLPLPLLSHLGTDAKLEYLLMKTKQVWALKEQTCQMRTSALLQEILCRVLLITGVVRGTGGDPRVQKAANHVMEHIHEGISAMDLGDAVGLHPGYLNKLIHRHTGMTLSHFVTNIRVNMAEDALNEEHITVTQAAERFGFSDIFHFSKVFRQFKGYSPSKAKTFAR